MVERQDNESTGSWLLRDMHSDMKLALTASEDAKRGVEELKTDVEGLKKGHEELKKGQDDTRKIIAPFRIIGNATGAFSKTTVTVTITTILIIAITTYMRAKGWTP